MRVLIISVALACAFAAPSELIPAGVDPSAIPLIAAPTLSPGDIQAAAIDAQVKAQDQARTIAEQERLLEEQARDLADIAKQQSELAIEEQKEQTEVTEAKEKALDKNSESEEQKWQALQDIQTAEAQIDGVVARNAPKLAKSAFAGVVGVYPPTIGAPLPHVIAPIVSPIVYARTGVYAPLAKLALDTQKTEEEKTSEATVKVADEKSKDSATVNTDGAVKAIETSNTPYIITYGFAPTQRLADQWVQGPLGYYQPGIYYSSSSLQQIHSPGSVVVV